MYKNFFGLRENPFNANPDPRYLYLTPQTQEILGQLTYGIENRKGLILLTGEVGTGKTTLINYLLDWLRQQKMPTAFIFNCRMSVNHLFDFILNDFGIATELRLKGNMLLQLNQWLLECFRRGLTPVLIMDEVQGSSFELLEEVRLLLNLETASEKLLQIVLAGQPEIEDKLNRPEMRQLRQRISLRCRTAPLTLEESYGYIAERLRIAGAAGDPVFSPEAVEAVHFYSRGIPRVMNLLCEDALINAYVEQRNPVVGAMVEEAARDFLMDEFYPKPGRSSAQNNHSDRHPDRRSNGHPNVPASVLRDVQPVLAMDRARPLTSQETYSPVAENGPVAIAADCEEPLFLGEAEGFQIAQDGNQALSMVKPRQPKQELSLESIACPPDSVAELMATMKRMLTTSPAAPAPHLVPPRRENKPISHAINHAVVSSEERARAAEKMNAQRRNDRRVWVRARFVYWRAWGSSVRAVLPPVLRAEWTRMLATVVRWNRQQRYPQMLMRRWAIEFKHDWNEMMNSIGYRQIKSSLLRWLRQPLSSKSMAAGKH